MLNEPPGLSALTSSVCYALNVTGRAVRLDDRVSQRYALTSVCQPDLISLTYKDHDKLADWRLGTCRLLSVTMIVATGSPLRFTRIPKTGTNPYVREHRHKGVMANQ